MVCKRCGECNFEECMGLSFCDNCEEILPDPSRKLIYCIDNDLEDEDGPPYEFYLIVDEKYFKKECCLRDQHFNFPEIPTTFFAAMESTWEYNTQLAEVDTSMTAIESLEKAGIKFSQDMQDTFK